MSIAALRVVFLPKAGSFLSTTPFARAIATSSASRMEAVKCFVMAEMHRSVTSPSKDATWSMMEMTVAKIG